MKRKLVILCGALVVIVAAVTISVASRGASSISNITIASVEALSQYEWGPIEGGYLRESVSSTVTCEWNYYDDMYGCWDTILYEATATNCYWGSSYCYGNNDPCD
jgi:hypothetical protein